MKQLTEEQFELCHKYLVMINAIDEGFSYVIASFTDYSKTEGDLVLSDIFQALNSIAQTNVLIDRLLVEDELVQQAIENFQDVTDAACKLDGHFGQYDTKINIINTYLYPAFLAWRDIIWNALSRYVSQ